jgi:hypothetical protein
MTTPQHRSHLQSRISHSDCSECRADTEKRFVDTTRWNYAHVREYLAYVRPLLALIRAGHDSTDAAIWLRKFRAALDRRISLKAGVPLERKRCDSYLERLGQFPRSTDAAYLRRFAARGASCLDY